MPPIAPEQALQAPEGEPAKPLILSAQPQAPEPPKGLTISEIATLMNVSVECVNDAPIVLDKGTEAEIEACKRRAMTLAAAIDQIKEREAAPEASNISEANSPTSSPSIEGATAEATRAPGIVAETDDEARELGDLLRAWDRARPRVRKKFMERTGLYAGIPPFLDRREPVPADRAEAGVATAAGRDEALKHK